MDRQIINFSANEQSLIRTGGTDHYAGNIVRYIEAHFDLGANWSGYDSVRAIWRNKRDVTRYSTVLNSEGVCVVPFEVLTLRGDVCMNLVGSIVENDVLVDRLTTYPICALTIDVPAMVDGSDPASITPSEYEQFVASVRNDADRAETGATASEASASEASASAEQATLSAQASEASALRSASSAQTAQTSERNASEYAQDAHISAQNAETWALDAEEAKRKILSMRAEATTLAEGSQATASYSDGLLTLGIPKGDTGARGEKGETGETGATPNLSIGTVETLDPDESATATITGTAENPVLNLGIPQGRTGEVTYEDLESILPRDTATGNPVTITDGQSVIPVKSLEVELEPIQDLHGYDKPWAGGAGKNILPITLSDGATSGLNYTVLKDNSGNVLGISLQGTPTAAVIELEMGSVTLTEGVGYKINGCSYPNSNLRIQLKKRGSSKSIVQVYNGRDANYVPAETAEFYVTFAAILNGRSVNQTIYPMIRLATDTDDTYAPYSNICPISGRTEVVTQRTGVNVWDRTYENGKWLEDTSGIVATASGYNLTDFISVVPSKTYYKSVSGSGRALFYDADKNVLPSQVWNTISSGATQFTVPQNAKYVRFVITTPNISTFVVNYPNTDHDFHTYQSDTYHTEIEGNYTVTSTNNTPYLLKEVSGIDGDRLREKIVGGSVAWNQLIDKTTRPYKSGTGTISSDESTGIVNIEITGSGDFQWHYSSTQPIRSHKIFELCKVTASENCEYTCRAESFGRRKSLTANTPTEMGDIIAVGNYSGTAAFGGRFANLSNVPLTATIEDFIAIDLTQMLGSTIADYIFNLEQTTAGAGVAWFKEHFAPNDYYPYNSGELLSVQTSAHVTKDANDNVIGNYPLDSSLTLRGIPKLSDGKMYYDGDEYESDGAVTRKYGVVDLGTLNWAYTGTFFYVDIANLMKLPSSVYVQGNILSAKYQTVTYAVGEQATTDKIVFLPVSTTSYKFLYVRDTAYTDVTAFKTAMSGVMLVYELATPTTETADSFEAIQKVINGGTEEYIDEREVPVPVGHETEYLSRETYGGTLDVVSGELVVDRIFETVDGSRITSVNKDGAVWRVTPTPNLTPSGRGYVNGISNLYPWATSWGGISGMTIGIAVNTSQGGEFLIRDDSLTSLTDFKTRFNETPIQLCYELATPQTYQLDPQEISLLHGTNNVWSDGDITMVYNADVGLYIDKKLGTSGTRTLSMTKSTKSEETELTKSDAELTKSDNIQLAGD